MPTWLYLLGGGLAVLGLLGGILIVLCAERECREVE